MPFTPEDTLQTASADPRLDTAPPDTALAQAGAVDVPATSAIGGLAALPDTAAGAVRLHASAVSRLNLADFQNAVPALLALEVVNEGAAPLHQLTLSLACQPAFIEPRTWTLDTVGPGETFRVTALDVQLDGARLSQLTEAETATLTFALRSDASPGAVLAHHRTTLELLARNQWGGIGQSPQMVAAFVQPNDPAIDAVLKAAAQALQEAGKPAQIDGYGQAATRAWELASAIWTAVLQLRLHYALPPASFEHSGQKVRSPGQIVDAGLSTCLDLSLLFAACLEQAHLHPLLVFTQGHVFVGLWLREETFASAVIDDVTALRKRLKLNELLVFESTLAAQGRAVAFSQAIAHANRQLSEAEQDTFELAIDIRRARMARIRPLALAQPPGEPLATSESGQAAPIPAMEEAPELPSQRPADTPTAELDPKDRLARWQRKLLDLSLRNGLLNFKTGRKALALQVEAGALEDALAGGYSLKLLALPELMQGSDPRSQALHEARTLEDLRGAHAAQALARREVFVPLEPEELDMRLVELYRAARNALQEGGANTLFVALGFLAWTRADRPQVRLRAPLVLLPVTLERKSARSGFTLQAHEDEALFNPTLVEMLRQDFQLELGLPGAELPRDDAGLDLPGIWKQVRTAIKDIRGWEVSEDAVLSMFSFAKYLMWKDLVERTDELRKSPVVAHLIDSPREPYLSAVDFPEERTLDADYPPEQVFSPLPADSSQLAAMLAAAKGKDFVLIGPPGTGKSQTIANLIAHCMAQGKRVLFVAEKIAALDVVYRRLREVGLGEFCLQLHSNKSRKLEVLAQLQKSWDSQGAVDAAGWQAKAQQLQRVRLQLSTYVERLHHRHDNGWSIYHAMGLVAAGADLPELSLHWPAPQAHDAAALGGLHERVGQLQANAGALGAQQLAGGPLEPVHASQWSARWQQELARSAQALESAAQGFALAADALGQHLGLSGLDTLDRHGRLALGSLARALPQAAHQGWAFCAEPDSERLVQELSAGAELLAQHQALSARLPAPWPQPVLAQLAQALELLARRQRLHAELPPPWPGVQAEALERGVQWIDETAALRASLSVSYGAGVQELPLAPLQRQWLQAGQAVWPLSWWGRRKVRRALEGHIEGAGEPRIAEDLAALVRIQHLQRDIGQLQPGSAAAPVWAGIGTRTDHARGALQVNAALQAARMHQPFDLAGLEPALQGHCGDACTQQARQLQALHALDEQLAGHASLTQPSQGLWRGLQTDAALLQAALAFAQDSSALQHQGALAGAHPQVAQGLCGPQLQQHCTHLQARAALESRLLSLDALLAPRCPGVWHGLQTDTQSIAQAVRFHASLQAALARLGLAPALDTQVRERLAQLLGSGAASLADTAPVGRACAQLLVCLAELHGAAEQFSTLAAQPDEVRRAFADQGATALARAAGQVHQHQQELHAWCAWRHARQAACGAGLGPLVDALQAGTVAPAQLARVFEVNYARWWLADTVDQDDVLKRFVSAEHEHRIQEFRALDDEFTALTRQWIRARLCAALPAADSIQRNSEWGLLRREITKKRQHLPLRQLLQHIPSVVLQLTPCLLMSPLSIAQYLSPNASNFDLVVFDEASQIPVWDAIGAMARARQVVMVGDPKQLPPTNFFERGSASDDDTDSDLDGAPQDLESILDECLGASLPTRRLSWHYRSRHESLIAFSNHRYYGGSLVTFPSPVTNDRAVSLHPVAGTYAKGGARTNVLEAKALVADLVGRLRSTDPAQAGLTIGVVTFNAEQQGLIEDLLDAERRNDPGLEPHFSDAQLEPVFVKNLEGVQGDERDIMYFSITYGPDLSGAVSMNFGPLNRDGGERRLNVAVTRARQELRVFSSLSGDQIDLSRTQAAGVRDLKHFLEFAERGPRALAEAHTGSQGDFESPFEASVAQALERKGWQVHTQIGASSFRVDLGVVHPDFAGRYLAGVECDGATYHRSATARDRDKLREQVLRGLGWSIVRIWSTDWWVNPGGTLERVHQQLADLLERDRQQRPLPASQTPVDAASALPAAPGAAQEIPRQAGAGPNEAPWPANPDAHTSA